MATKACLRWGICSAGQICHDFVSALRTLPHAEHKVVAVAARDLARAQEFAKLHQITNAYGSYEELARDTDVDVIYIGTATHEHCRLTLLMLNHGKPVLCEKPLASNLKEAQEMISLAKQKKLFLMEGFWTRFFPAAIKLREEIANGTIGDVRLVDTRGFYNLLENPPEKFFSPSYSGGSIMLLGCYGIQYCSMIYGEKPMKISASGHLYDTGTDKLAIVTLIYSSGRAAVIKTALEVTCTPTNSVTVYGTKGSMKIGPIQWCPVELKTPTETLNFPAPEPAVKGNYPNTGGFQYQAEAVRQCLIKGELESSTMPHEHSLWNMEILDEVRRQLGIHFPADDK
ncbi:trans-1,2-dihydrobenzene-1,2-diol dehydrogenase-like [Lingula anatina]|uniref:Trans-1,2-dihydrobenzene-1,2-diol dehydrogenase n=1 Tax=Lingula anatina TaxID=7574 RepID=A0A1S3JM53_LINAN|nr:trans-1,2-dihydrobenzene-1,2-diol dehydrogenase-like [Lingula anatina]XP_013410990.1 trans-1,2-dihydrobenzene-1,2-diol dehydrogenase-like [Lingula anatina]|eukprot:XP_013410989.1 trans-1,2-dihydrobenzene-1,2-diol dehydrogenase-like [Lingula anatina]